MYSPHHTALGKIQYRTYSEGNNRHEKMQQLLSYQNLTNSHQFRFSY